MKKSFFLLTAVAALTTLASCGGEGPLRVAMDLRYPPFETVDSENTPEGISVDIANAFGTFLGRDTEIVNTNFGGIIPAIQAEEVDIAIASMSITAARQEVVDFSNPYFYFKIITLVNKTFADANSLTIDSTTEELIDLAENEGARFAGIASQVSATIPQSYGITVTEYPDLGTAIENVAQGTADILLMSASPVVSGFKANPDTTLVVWDPWVASPIGMAVQKGNTELLEQANAFIETFDDEGGLYDVLRAAWDDVIYDQLDRYGLDFYITAE
jgi:polar amino acid transport system substrate-binding protein